MHRIGGIQNNCKSLWIQVNAELAGVQLLFLGSSTLYQGWIRPFAQSTHLLAWIERVNDALRIRDAAHPFLAYATGWLAFAHFVIAIAFAGPYIDPVGDKWLITWGLIASAGVIKLALIAGPIRGIAFPWRLIDCSFGIIGSVPLLLAMRSIRALETEQAC